MSSIGFCIKAEQLINQIDPKKQTLKMCPKNVFKNPITKLT